MKESFFKNHGDTLAIIGVNIALIAMMLTLWTSANSRTDAVNTRMDATIALIYQESKDFHARLCVIEEKNRK